MNSKSIIKTVPAFSVWLEQRPIQIQALAKEFPFGTVWNIRGENLVVVGWSETDTVLFSRLHLNSDDTPDVDRMLSAKERLRICAKHLRERWSQ